MLTSCRRLGDLQLQCGGKQGARIWVAGIGEDFCCLSAFADLSVLHDDNAVGHGAYDTEIVADEQVSKAMPFLQPLQEGDNLPLH